MEKKNSALRVIFAFALILYIVVAILAIFVFDMGQTPEISLDFSLFGRELEVSVLDSMPAYQIFCTLFPAYFFLCSLMLTKIKK